MEYARVCEKMQLQTEKRLHSHAVHGLQAMPKQRHTRFRRTEIGNFQYIIYVLSPCHFVCRRIKTANAKQWALLPNQRRACIQPPTPFPHISIRYNGSRSESARRECVRISASDKRRRQHSICRRGLSVHACPN